MSDSDKQALIDGSATVQTEIVVHNENLFDKNNINEIGGYYIDSTGKVVAGAYNYLTWVQLQPNTTYTLLQPKKSNVTVRIGLFSQQPDSGVTGTVVGTFTGTTGIVQTFTTTSTNIYLSWVYCNTNNLNGYTKQEMLDSVRIEEGTPVSLTETNSVIDWNHEDFRLVKEEGWIGQFVARQVTGNLKDLSDDFSITDKELELKLGVRTNNNTNWYSLGNFLVTKVTDDEVNDKTSFEALDYTKKFNKVFVDRLDYPVTALELAQDVCDQCGVELGSTTFKNSDYVIQGNAFTNNESCRDVMKAIGKLAFSWVRIDWDNKVYIDFDPLPFKNQFDKDNANVLNATINTSNRTITAGSSNRTIYIPCKPDTTYTLYKKSSPNNRVIGYSSTLPSNGTVLSYISTIGANATTKTITTGNDAQYLVVWVWNSGQDSETTFDEMLDSIIIKQQPSQYETFGNNKYYNLKTQKEVFGPVDKVVIGYSAIEGERTYIGEENGTCVLNIFDNPLVFNQEQRATIIESARDLLGFTYTPLNTLTVGHPWLKGNEIVRVSDMESVSHNTIPFDRTIQYFGHIKTLINSTTETKTNDNLSYKPEMVKNYERSEIYNDQINKQIGIIINEQTDTSNRLNETISTLDGTIQRVSNTETSITDITTTTQVSTGKNSLYLEDAIEGNALSYSVDGATEQNGTPTPDNPVEVKTIPSIINLFDKDKFQEFTTSIKFIEMTLKPNTTYIMSSNIPTQSTNTNAVNLFFLLDGQSASSTNNGVKPNQPRIQTTDSTGKVKIGYRDYISEYTDEANTYWYMLEEGSVAHEYVPYGYWSKVKVTGKNMTQLEEGGIAYNTGLNNTTSTLVRSNKYIPYNTTDTYYFSLNNQLISGDINLRFYNAKYEYLGYQNVSTGSGSNFTITPVGTHTDTTPRYFRFQVNKNIVPTIDSELMVANDNNLTYEPYKENQVLIDMSKENLFDINSTNTTSNCNVSITDNIMTITQSGSYPYVEYSMPNLINGETYTISFDYTKPEDGQISVRIYDNTTMTYNVPNFSTPTSGNKFLTFTANENTKIRFYGRVTSGTNTSNVTYSNINIFKGNKPTPYYELCKIGDYKDTLLVDSSGNCVINKNVGKRVFNGSESWAYQITNGYRTDISNIKQTTSGGEDSYVISNYYQTEKQQNLSNVNYGISNRANQSQIIIKNKDCADSTALKTWLSTHNTDVYYVLATPETINLPNTKIPLFEGINHVTFVDDLETDTSITYYRNTPLSGTYATMTQLNDVSTEKTQEIIQVRNEVQTEITSTQASINVINETIENGVSKVNGTGYTFDSEGLKIEKTNQDVKSLLDNDGLAVSYKGTDLLTVRSNGIEAENMTVRKFYVQRPIRMEKTKSISDGSSVGLGFFYVGEED